MRTNIDDVIGDCRRGPDDLPGLVAPQLFARAGIEGIEQLVLRTNVDHSIGNGRRGADTIPGGVAPDLCACGGIESV